MFTVSANAALLARRPDNIPCCSKCNKVTRVTTRQTATVNRQYSRRPVSCVRYAAKIRILDTHILHPYTPSTGFSEPIYLGVYGVLRKNSFWGEGVGHERI